MIGNPLLLPDEGYNISRSVRLRQSASAYFNRTPGSAGNRRTWTWSGWVKRGILANQIVFNAGVTTTRFSGMQFTSGNKIEFFEFDASSAFIFQLTTTAVFRDPSAWYHVVIAFDTTQSTASNRLKLYVNGVQVTAFDTANYPAQNTDYSINNNVSHQIGRSAYNAGELADLYLTEVNFIDGQALTPSSFGETDAITGVWKPKKYTGTYGTNGFYLNFSDPSAATAAAIGKDYSGNGNNWTPNNISVTSGVTYDSMLDVPTLWADGGNGRGNYAVLNPLDQLSVTVTQGNLYLTCGASTSAVVPASVAMTSGKWYAEFTPDGAQAANNMIGICNLAAAANNRGYASANGWYYFGNGGQKYTNNTGASYGASYTAGDVIGVAFDADAGTLTFYKNGTSQGAAFTGLTGATYAFAVNSGTGSAGVADFANFGQRPFAYTPPTGFRALNTQNLPEPVIRKPNAWFDVLTWTGADTSTSRTFTGLQFAPDLFWSKPRSQAYNHIIYDRVRGAGSKLALAPSGTFSESTFTADEYGYLSSFNSDGVTWTRGSLGSGTNPDGYADYDELNATYVAWSWKEGATPGFDIVTYTGNGTSGRTVAHSLGVAPAMIIVKSRSAAGTNWNTYHASANASPATVFLNLNQTIAATVDSTAWNNTAPTSSVFSVGNGSGVNTNAATYVAYLFADVAGFSKFGSYTGNGSSDGPFVFTGFRPRWVMLKNTTTGGTNWIINDTSRAPVNVMINPLLANASGAEQTSYGEVDTLSNGIKIRGTPGTQFNNSGDIYIYAAFAEFPFRTALAR